MVVNEWCDVDGYNTLVINIKKKNTIRLAPNKVALRGEVVKGIVNSELVVTVFSFQVGAKHLYDCDSIN